MRHRDIYNCTRRRQVIVDYEATDKQNRKIEGTIKLDDGLSDRSIRDAIRDSSWEIAKFTSVKKRGTV